MSAPIISIRGIGKRFVLGESAGHDTLRDHLAAGLRSIVGRKKAARPATEHWALRNVSFDVNEGEVVGIIGRNGAGKSTLLKILSQISEPTEGEIRLRGRMASLLEVGTGFHPELTGRENIFLNGAILGMTQTEIRHKFDEIIAFAGVEKFLDTPVKRYSSGMYVRLAFAVAAHLEPEILVVDEVLAVGDASFQKKCMGKIGSLAQHGRTVLFVSHNMAAIRQLCQRAVLLETGNLVMDGPSGEVTERYLQEGHTGERSDSIQAMIEQLPPDPSLQIKSVALTQNGKPSNEHVLNGLPLEIAVGYSVLESTPGLRVYFDLCDNEGTLLFRSFHDEDNDEPPLMPPGAYESKATIPADFLAPTDYRIRVKATVFPFRHITPGDGIDIPFRVERSGKIGRTWLQYPVRGKLAPDIPWTTAMAKKQNVSP